MPMLQDELQLPFIEKQHKYKHTRRIGLWAKYLKTPEECIATILSIRVNVSVYGHL